MPPGCTALFLSELTLKQRRRCLPKLFTPNPCFLWGLLYRHRRSLLSRTSLLEVIPEPEHRGSATYLTEPRGSLRFCWLHARRVCKHEFKKNESLLGAFCWPAICRVWFTPVPGVAALYTTPSARPQKHRIHDRIGSCNAKVKHAGSCAKRNT